MEIIKIVGFGIVASSLIILLRQQKPEIALMCVIAASVIILFIVMNELKGIVELLNNLISKTNINSGFLKIILKVIGISYIVEFGKSICKDAGEGAIANKIEIAGKVIIISLSVPVLTSLLDIVSK